MKIRYSILTRSDIIKGSSLIAWTQKQGIQELSQTCHWLWVCALILRKNILSSRISWIILRIHQSFYLPSVLCVTEVSKLYLMDQIYLTTHCDDSFYWCIAMPVEPWCSRLYSLQRQKYLQCYPLIKKKKLIFPYHFQTHFCFRRSFPIPKLWVLQSPKSLFLFIKHWLCTLPDFP